LQVDKYDITIHLDIHTIMGVFESFRFFLLARFFLAEIALKRAGYFRLFATSPSKNIIPIRC
jgi:hypothetical protein